MRTVLAAILFIVSSITAANAQSITEQNPLSLSAIPVSDTLTAKQMSQQPGETEGRFWASGEALVWKTKGANLPPLITTGPYTGGGVTDRGGILGEAGTVIAFGGGALDRGVFFGGRFTAGAWLNRKKSVGVEVSYFFLPEKTVTVEASASGLGGSNVVARPFFDILTGQESAVIVASPFDFITTGGTHSGIATGTSSSRLWGGEANLIYRFDKSGCCRLNLIGGFRYLDLSEGLSVSDLSIIRLSPSFGGAVGRSSVRDDFSSRNRFYGGQVGTRTNYGWGRFSLGVAGTLAFGVNRELVNISGSSVINTPGINETRVGAILAQRSNIGSHRRSEFAFVPEIRVDFGYDLTRTIRPFVSYDFLYWNRVVQAGEQIDRAVNPFLLFGRPALPGADQSRPAFTFRGNDYWVTGLTTGVKLRF